jgi:hypothetical protein
LCSYRRRRCQNPRKRKNESIKTKQQKKEDDARQSDSDGSGAFISASDGESLTEDSMSSEDDFIPSPYVRPVANKISPMKTHHHEEPSAPPVKIVEKKSVTGRRILTKLNLPSPPKRSTRSKVRSH